MAHGSKKSRSRKRLRTVYGRTATGMFLTLFLLGTFLLQQNTKSILADSSEQVRASHRLKLLRGPDSTLIPKSRFTAKGMVEAPRPPIKRVGIYQGGSETLMECGQDCVQGYLICTQEGTFISPVNDCCAKCCWEAFPGICSDQNCCGDELPIQ